MQILYDGLPKILGALLYDCLHTPLGADEVDISCGTSSLLYSVMKVDRLTLCE